MKKPDKSAYLFAGILFFIAALYMIVDAYPFEQARVKDLITIVGFLLAGVLSILANPKE